MFHRPLIVLGFLVTLISSGFAQSKPNILIIYADDVGYGDLGCYGATALETPNLDRLAKGGLRFTSAYATSSTCTPSRYSLLTGAYAFRRQDAQILPGDAPLLLDPEKPSLPSILKNAGYRTGLVGKWHLGLGTPESPANWNGTIAPGPREVGFDYSFHMAATGDRVPTVYIRNGQVVDLNPSDPIEVDYIHPVGDDPTGISHPELLKVQADTQHSSTIVDGISRIGYMSGGDSARWNDESLPDTFLDEALNFIEESHEEPFFLYYATHENHVPRWPHPRFRGSTRLGVRGDAIVQMDWGVGKVIEKLQQLGIAENTLIIFSSDNGPVLFDGYYDGAYQKNGDHKPAGPWRGGKYSSWEGGTRMPFIVSWPGTVIPGLSGALISQVDLLTSLARLGGATLPESTSLDSQDILDTLLGRTDQGRSFLIEQGIDGLAIRQGDWKYIPEGRVRVRAGVDSAIFESIPATGALFYLPEDPAESNNLAKAFPDKAEAMKALLEATIEKR